MKTMNEFRRGGLEHTVTKGKEMFAGAWFTSRTGMEDLTLEKPEYCLGEAALISIHDPDTEPSPFAEQWKRLLVISFWDLEQHDAVHGHRTISLSEAKRIVVFVRENVSKVSLIVINCEQGVSRSAAVAKFIAEEYDVLHGGRTTGEFYNKHVYAMLQQAAREEC